MPDKSSRLRLSVQAAFMKHLLSDLHVLTPHSHCTTRGKALSRLVLQGKYPPTRSSSSSPLRRREVKPCETEHVQEAPQAEMAALIRYPLWRAAAPLILGE